MTVVSLRGAETPRNRGGLWPTNTTVSLKAIIENCRTQRTMGVITGPSGIGKTTAARAAVRAAYDAEIEVEALTDPTIAFVAMTLAASGIHPGLLRLAGGLGITVRTHWGAHELHEALIQHSWGRGSLVVLDEAQFMSDELLHGIRSLWDELEQHHRPVGIVLVGTPELRVRINARSRKYTSFEAFRGRLGVNLELGQLETGDCAAICTHYGLTEAKAQALVRRVAAHPGGLHNVKRLLAQAERAAPDGHQIALEDLMHAAELAGVAS